MVDQGIIVNSKSSWASPMLPVRKPNGKVRVCMDFCQVNSISTSEGFYMPLLDEIVQEIVKIPSKLDLVKGFYQVPMSLVDEQKTAFICPIGR